MRSSDPSAAHLTASVAILVPMALAGCSLNSAEQPLTTASVSPRQTYEQAYILPAPSPASRMTWQASPPSQPRYTAADVRPVPAYGATGFGHPPVTGYGYSRPALPPGMIEVQQGDTLFGLSRRHGVSVAQLVDTNRLRSITLQPGQRLVLPTTRRW